MRSRKLAMRLWWERARLSSLLRARRSTPRQPVHQRQLVAELAPQRSFIDVGGMWGISGDIAFLAEQVGATRVVVLDGMDPTEDFERRHRELDSAIEYVQGDLHDPVLIERLGQFDVVWCSGVIYHSPNPFLQIEHLRRLCAERLMLSSRVIPEIPGFEQACLWYPGSSPAAQAALAHGHGKDASDLLGACAPLEEAPGMGYVNTWWGLTVSALQSMVQVARFDVERVIRYSPIMVDLVAHPVDKPSLIPDPSFARRRGEGRVAEVPLESRPRWLGTAPPAGPRS